jgi:hypothetical protein
MRPDWSVKAGQRLTLGCHDGEKDAMSVMTRGCVLGRGLPFTSPVEVTLPLASVWISGPVQLTSK